LTSHRRSSNFFSINLQTIIGLQHIDEEKMLLNHVYFYFLAKYGYNFSNQMLKIVQQFNTYIIILTHILLINYKIVYQTLHSAKYILLFSHFIMS